MYAIHDESNTRITANRPWTTQFNFKLFRDLCVHMHAAYMYALTIVCVCECVQAHVYITFWPLLPYITQALPTIRHTARVPDTPLNPLPGTLTASPWEADPEGPAKRFVHTKHTHTCKLAALIQTYTLHMHSHMCVYCVGAKGLHSFWTGLRN